MLHIPTETPDRMPASPSPIDWTRIDALRERSLNGVTARMFLWQEALDLGAVNDQEFVIKAREYPSAAEWFVTLYQAEAILAGHPTYKQRKNWSEGAAEAYWSEYRKAHQAKVCALIVLYVMREGMVR